jgi:hypothetical protein
MVEKVTKSESKRKILCSGTFSSLAHFTIENMMKICLVCPAAGHAFSSLFYQQLPGKQGKKNSATGCASMGIMKVQRLACRYKRNHSMHSRNHSLSPLYADKFSCL